MRAALFIQLNCFETITKDFHECFAGKLLFASPKKTLALLQLNLEQNHINIKEMLRNILPMVNRLKYLNI